MPAAIKAVVSIPKTLFDQVEILAQQLNISPDHLLGLAVEHFIKNYQGLALPDEINRINANQHDLKEPAVQRMINQGDVYWVQLEEPGVLEPGIAHPYVVVQHNVFTRSRIHTVVVCALTSNLKQANAPGNVILEVGEANLPRQSVVVVSKISTVDKMQLGEYIGSLSGQRIDQILVGMQFLQLMTEHHEISAVK